MRPYMSVKNMEEDIDLIYGVAGKGILTPNEQE
jgi:hypothetical protein